MHESRKYRRRYILMNIGLEWLFLLVVGLLFSTMFGEILNLRNENFQFILAGIIILMLYKSINRYIKFMKFTERFDLINKVKRESKAKMKLEQNLLYYEESMEIQKQKLNNLKAFSPIPIIIVSVEYFTRLFSINVIKLFSDISSLNFDLNESEWVALLLFGSVIYYAHIYLSTWNSYKNSVAGYYEMKRHLTDVGIDKSNKLKYFS